MKLPSSTEVYLAMIPRRSSLVSCFGSGSESMSSSMIAVVLSSIDATGCARRAVFMWIPREVVFELTLRGAWTVTSRHPLRHEGRGEAEEDRAEAVRHAQIGPGPGRPGAAPDYDTAE